MFVLCNTDKSKSVTGIDFTVNTRHSKMAFAVRKKDEADKAKKTC
ncbi:hypothetical protein [Fervidobacterium sp.]